MATVKENPMEPQDLIDSNEHAVEGPTALMQRGEPAYLLELAIQQNLDIEKLERLMELQERWKREQARTAYYEALSRFQSLVPRIPKRKKVQFNQTQYSYAPLADIEETIKPAMLDCGLTKRWEIKDDAETIMVTCVITHVQGHSETTAMAAAPDASGSKNVIQQRGSTITYLQRYTLIGALGLATADDDIDARLGIPADPITESQALDLKALMEEVKADHDKFLEYAGVQKIGDIPAKDYKKLIRALEAKRTLPKKEKAHASR
jgi:ERF superfamily